MEKNQVMGILGINKIYFLIFMLNLIRPKGFMKKYYVGFGYTFIRL